MSSILQSANKCAVRSGSIGTSALLSGWLLSGFIGWGVGLAQSASAQVVADDSLGTVVQSSGASWRIEAGSQAGENLFHSFDKFSIPAGGQVRFESGSGIRRIFGRVTGGAPSQIEGAIAADTDLFLLNPSGILFGPGAKLNVSGQFVGTTAEQIDFGDGRTFSSLRPAASIEAPLLSLSIPTGLQFGNHSGGIELTGPGHQLATLDPNVFPLLQGQRSPTLSANGNIALLGKHVRLAGASLVALGQRVELGAVAQGQVGLEGLGEGLEAELDYSTVEQRGELTLSERSLVEASATPDLPAGSIRLIGDRVSLTGASVTLLENGGTGSGGSVEVDATQSLELNGLDFERKVRSQIASQALGNGAGGTVAVTAPEIQVINGGAIASLNFGAGKAGNLALTARNITLEQTSDEFRNAARQTATLAVPVIVSAAYSSGSGGAIRLQTEQLKLADGGNISNFTFGAGDTGSMVVTANQIEARGYDAVAPAISSGINSFSISSGNAQNIDIVTDTLSLREGATIVSSVSPTLNSFGVPATESGLGNSGNIAIVARKFVEVIGVNPLITTSSSINTNTFGDGQGGNTFIQTPRLNVLAGGTVASTTLSSGDAGQLNVLADQIRVSGVAPLTGAASSITTGAPRANRIFQQQFQVPALVTGATGKLALIADSVIVRDGGFIAAQHEGEGDAGRLEITANQLQLDRGLITAATAAGQGGNIMLNLQRSLLLRQGSRISAESGDRGEGGNINIASTTTILIEDSEILANARAGKGGNINIATQSLLLSPSSQIMASSELGVSGTVKISAAAGLPGLSLEALPEQVPDLSQLITKGCANHAENQLVASGRGGLAEAPTQPRSGLALWRDRDPAANHPAPAPRLLSDSARPQHFTEAIAIGIGPSGDIQLLAHDSAAAIALTQRCLSEARAETKKSRKSGTGAAWLGRAGCRRRGRGRC